jgi:hypothetical protein
MDRRASTPRPAPETDRARPAHPWQDSREAGASGGDSRGARASGGDSRGARASVEALARDARRNASVRVAEDASARSDGRRTSCRHEPAICGVPRYSPWRWQCVRLSPRSPPSNAACAVAGCFAASIPMCFWTAISAVTCATCARRARSTEGGCARAKATRSSSRRRASGAAGCSSDCSSASPVRARPSSQAVRNGLDGPSATVRPDPPGAAS